MLREHAVWDGDTVNWPPIVGSDADRVQWCHGAPGIVATLGDLMPEDLLLAGAETTWRAGPLEKGPGLCHGTAGNGYALLKTYAVTRDEMWLERARSFATAHSASCRIATRSSPATSARRSSRRRASTSTRASRSWTCCDYATSRRAVTTAPATAASAT